MYCPNCGNELNDNQNFCSNCGTKIIKKEEIKEIEEEVDVKPEAKAEVTAESTTINNTNTVNNNYKNHELKEDDRKNGNKLSRISLLMLILSPFSIYIFPSYTFNTYYSTRSNLLDAILFVCSGTISIMYILLHLAGLVIAIIAKVKYPKNTFAKIMLAIYIVLFSLAILGILADYSCTVWAQQNCSGCN